MNKEEIKADFERIKQYLSLPCSTHLIIQNYHIEGFYNHYSDMVILGIKDGYDRQLLVHECLHATGLQHTVSSAPIQYSSWLKEDEYSELIERKIFG